MAFENHLDSLKKKHFHLEQMLREEEARPAPDELVQHRIKLQKLNLKDEIERLLHSHSAAAA